MFLISQHWQKVILTAHDTYTFLVTHPPMTHTMHMLIRKHKRNNNELFVAPHLVTAWGICKGLYRGAHSLYLQTHAHQHTANAVTSVSRYHTYAANHNTCSDMCFVGGWRYSHFQSQWTAQWPCQFPPFGSWLGTWNTTGPPIGTCFLFRFQCSQIPLVHHET